MADQSGSTGFLPLYKSALQAYEKNAGITLAEHPLALQIQSCDSVESIASILQSQAQALGEFQGSDRVMKTIKSTVSILTRLSSTASLAVGAGLVRQHALMPCLFTDRFCSHTRLRRLYTPVLPYYLLYVPSSIDIRTFMTSKRIRRPRASLPAMTHSSTCSSPSNIFFVVLIYMRGSHLLP